MKCDEGTRLLEAYNRATLTLSTAVQNLLSGGEAIASVVYDMHRRAAAQARKEFEATHLAYETHVELHHCQSGVGGGGTSLEIMASSV